MMKSPTFSPLTFIPLIQIREIIGGYSSQRLRRLSWPITLPVLVSMAANSEVVPFALVIMSPGFRLTRPHGQNGLRAIQRLNLSLLVNAQHQSLSGRFGEEGGDI